MFRIISTIALLALAQTAAVSASTGCAGADPAIASVSVKNVGSAGNLNRYELTGTVTNVGQVPQPSNTLQFVDIYQGSTKLDERGVPALAAGQSYTFTYASMRSRDAGAGTTHLSFRMESRDGMSVAAHACSNANGVYTVTF
jgi:hypothetical protein